MIKLRELTDINDRIEADYQNEMKDRDIRDQQIKEYKRYLKEFRFDKLDENQKQEFNELLGIVDDKLTAGNDPTPQLRRLHDLELLNLGGRTQAEMEQDEEQRRIEAADRKAREEQRKIEAAEIKARYEEQRKIDLAHKKLQDEADADLLKSIADLQKVTRPINAADDAARKEFEKIGRRKIRELKIREAHTEKERKLVEIENLKSQGTINESIAQARIKQVNEETLSLLDEIKSKLKSSNPSNPSSPIKIQSAGAAAADDGDDEFVDANSPNTNPPILPPPTGNGLKFYKNLIIPPKHITKLKNGTIKISKEGKKHFKNLMKILHPQDLGKVVAVSMLNKGKNTIKPKINGGGIFDIFKAFL